MSLVSRRALLSFLGVVSLVAAGAQSRAGPPADATDFVRHLVTAALDILKKNGSEADREHSFQQLLMRNFDIPRIARFVLGRYWAGAREEDRRKFVDTYGEFVIRSYAADFSNYAGETVDVTGTRVESENFFIVASQIVHPNGEPPVRISWRVHKGEDGFKVLDVDVEGISMLLAQREEFAAVIQRNGGTVAGLTDAIRQKIDGEARARPAN